MTQVTIKQQLEAQKKTTEKATKSKEAAKKYLASIEVRSKSDEHGRNKKSS